MAFVELKSGRKLIELTNLLSHHAWIYNQTNGNSKKAFYGRGISNFMAL